MSYSPSSRLGAVIDRIEVNGIALILGLMTLVTFANVIARYLFNSNILWALETTVFLFAWLVLLGASHGVKISAHIGVDLIVNAVNPGARKAMGLISAAACIAFAALLLMGAFDYWWPFATNRAWYEVNDIPMIIFPELSAELFNEGERYEKMPRFIPYAALPIGLTLLTLRFIQAGWEVLANRRETLIASHEAEDMMEEHAQQTAAAKSETGSDPDRNGREG